MGSALQGWGVTSLSHLSPFELYTKMITVPACTGTACVSPLALAPAVAQFGDTGATSGLGN